MDKKETDKYPKNLCLPWCHYFFLKKMIFSIGVVPFPTFYQDSLTFTNSAVIAEEL